jgi:phosphohistidine phosphatase
MSAASGDFERALTASGRKEVEAVAEGLFRLDLGVSIIATSPLKRAKETATIVAKVLKKEGRVEVWDELKPESETPALYRRLSKLKQDSSVLVVGHEPLLSGMVGELVAGTNHTRIALKKAGAAKVELTSSAPKPVGELRWLMTPKQLKKLG